VNSFDGRYRRQIAATEKSMGRGRRIQKGLKNARGKLSKGEI
jgi:hypothetical protein